MSELQSTLGESEGIAEELAAGQRSISIAEFFEKNKHMLGFDSGARALVTAVKEAVDNALDATEEANTLPDIYVEIAESGDYYKLIVEDNGPGITKNEIPKVFGKLLYGSRFHKREQSRGQQGIGISAAVLYSQLTSGKPAKITSRTKGSDDAEYFELIIDTDENEPEIQVERELTPGESDLSPTHGTRIELEMEANMRARAQLERYVQHTAVVNPHARITFLEPAMDEPEVHERATDDLPDDTEEIRPHPHGVELGTVIKMLNATSSHSVSGFLQEEFTRVGRKTADEILDAFRDRHFGREMSWRPPKSHEDADVEAAVTDAVANKSAEATNEFAQEVAKVVGNNDWLAHFELAEIVGNVADNTEEEYSEVFGTTVRENAVEAAWEAITADRRSDVYALVDAATSTQKDDATVDAVAQRVAAKFGDDENPRDRLTRATLAEFVDRAADMTEERDDATFGETARENVTSEIWSHMRRVPDDVPSVRKLRGDRDGTSDLVEAMRETDIMAPPTDCLSPISADLMEAGLKKEFDAEFFAAATRSAGVHAGDPFIAEAAIAYGGDLADDGTVDVLRFANRVPLVYQRGACATTDVVKNIGWRNYGLDQPGGSGLPNGPMVLMVHVASTNVPFTSESKDAVANVPEMEDEIELAIREAARELKSYLKKRRSLQKRRQKADVIAKILPEMARKVAEVTDRPEPDINDAMARIMNNVLLEREVEDGTVTLTVENHGSTSETPEITDIVSAEPSSLSDGATAIDMDEEWFVKWSPEVAGGDEASLTYEVDGDPSFDVHVEGIDEEKLTIDQ